MRPRSANGRNWSVRRVDEPPERPARLEVAGDLAQHVGDRHRQEQQAEEDHQQPALDPDAGVSQRRRFIPVRAVELAVEDRDRARVALAQPGGELLGDDDAAVVAAGAADRDRQPGLALVDVGRDREVEELLEEVEEAPVIGWPGRSRGPPRSARSAAAAPGT